ncbi:PKD domain-containing protein, partial [candidate division KSB1 bacterium]|nr:PKD domain-containing protein [candidate division KSB1 bacterium]
MKRKARRKVNMRSIKFALLMTMVFFIAGSVNANWSNESSVSAGAGPDLDIDPVTGHLHISAMNNGVIYTEMDPNGAIIHQERVPNTGGIPGAGVFGTAISVDTEGNPHVCYRTDDGNHIYDIYYTHKDQSGWSTPLLIDENVKRGYMIRIDVDAQNRVHGVYGSAEGDNVWGPVTYFRIENGSITKRHNNLTQYRADDRVEIDASDGDNIHIILGCPDPNGGPVSYWRSTDGGNTMQYAGDIHDSAAIDRNGSPDLFVDASGNVHFCYGAAKDRDVNGTPSVRYNRWQNSSQVRDVVATQQGDCKTWKQDQGIASLAASANGQTVMIAYTDTDGGDLYTTMSSDDGQHWQERDFIAAAVGGQESRNKHIIRAHGNTFYLVYPANGIKLRIYNSTPTDQPPTADAGGPYNAQPGESILFDGSNSTDDVGIISFEWDFGDGSTGSGVQVNHAYASEGVYDVTLTVTDSAGQTHSEHASAVIGTAASTDWGNEIHISSGDTPDFDIHRATGNLHLLVMKNGVTYIELNGRGQVLQEETVPGTSGEEGMMRFGASIAVDSHGYPHIGYRNYRGSNYYDLYYIYKTETGWSSPIKIADRVLRGYVVRLAIDGADRVYYCHSSVTNTTTNTGPVNMHVYQNGQKLFNQNNIDQTRGDERYELDVSENGIVDLVAGDLSYPSEGGPVYYWRSSSPGEQLRYMGDQHHTDARGANGSPDIFVDALNNTHICYGVELDRTIGRKPSLRYLRMENGSKIRDVRVTDDGELSDWKFGLGIGSVAASADGQTVVAAYTQTEDGDLYTRISQDGGDTWGNREKLSAGWHSAETRNKHLIRANGNAFYLIYPRDGIKLRIMGNPPQAQPYLMITPTELDFSNTQTEHSFTVKNSGGGTLTWNSGTVNAPWVTNIQPTGADLLSG